MSISDQIVVMKDGVVQQVGKPQYVYDDPVNLFVAKFLGTPPINVFSGSVRSGKLLIGEDVVMDVAGSADQEVTVAIRPEGFEPAADGVMTCDLTRVEVMGRDVSMVCNHPAFTGDSFRAIVSSDDLSLVSGTAVRFHLKKAKVFLFRSDDGQRIRF